MDYSIEFIEAANGRITINYQVRNYLLWVINGKYYFLVVGLLYLAEITYYSMESISLTIKKPRGMD